MARRGVIETNDQKARLGEVFVLDHFEEIGSIDFSGENKNSPCDGVCPKGYNYDVKTACFGGRCGYFQVKNINKDKIEWFYLLAFNKDFTKLLFVWRIPALDLMEDIEKGYIIIGSNKNYVHNLENLKEYEITEKTKHVFEKRQNSLRKWTKEEILADARSKIKIYVESKKCDIKNQFKDLAEKGKSKYRDWRKEVQFRWIKSRCTVTALLYAVLLLKSKLGPFE